MKRCQKVNLFAEEHATKVNDSASLAFVKSSQRNETSRVFVCFYYPAKDRVNVLTICTYFNGVIQ